MSQVTENKVISAPVPMTPLQEFWHYFKRNKGAVVGLVYVVIVLFIAIFANWIAPYNPAEQFRDALLAPPAWQEGGSMAHLLGTDDVGRDVLSRLMYGARLSLLVGCLVVVLSLIMGVILGLIAVAAGAGGHAGTKSPFALIQEIRQWFDGPLALSGSIASGGAILAAQAMGADFAYIGSAFIATHEARAQDAYKQAIVDSNSDDIVYSNLFTGVHGNYLAPSIRAAGLDPDNLPESDPSKMNFGGDAKKAWKDIWGCGQGIGAINAVTSTAELVGKLRREYEEARARLKL